MVSAVNVDDIMKRLDSYREQGQIHEFIDGDEAYDMINALDREVRRVRKLGMAYKERAMSAETKLARVEWLLSNNPNALVSEILEVLKGEP